MIYLLFGVDESLSFIFERSYLVRISLGIIVMLVPQLWVLLSPYLDSLSSLVTI